VERNPPPDPVCTYGYTLEPKTSANHGDICRKDDGSGSWLPPRGCDKVAGRPYAVKSGSSSPCRIDQSSLVALPVFGESGSECAGLSCCKATSNSCSKTKSSSTFEANGVSNTIWLRSALDGTVLEDTGRICKGGLIAIPDSTCASVTFLEISVGQCIACDVSCIACSGPTHLDCSGQCAFGERDSRGACPSSTDQVSFAARILPTPAPTRRPGGSTQSDQLTTTTWRPGGSTQSVQLTTTLAANRAATSTKVQFHDVSTATVLSPGWANSATMPVFSILVWCRLFVM